MKLLIAGDYFPSAENEEKFAGGGTNTLFGPELLRLFDQADYTVANLEGTFIDGGEKIKKQGPCLKASRKAFHGYAKLGLDAVSLGNNHSLDYGADGLYSTLELLKNEGICFFGAGENLTQAKKPLIVEVCGIKLGFYSIAEYEFTIATEENPGANPFDELYTLDDIQELKKQVDYLAVVYHGAKEYYKYPIPYVQRRCRRFVDKGADLVLCQHSHCIGCMETYKNATILYGQGNFFFCDGRQDKSHGTGLICSVVLPERKVTFIPVIDEGVCVRLANEVEREDILDEFWNRSEEIKKNDALIKTKYIAFANEKVNHYEALSMGKLGSLFKRLHLLRIIHRLNTERYDINMINTLRCEAHRDLFTEGLVNRINSVHRETALCENSQMLER